MANNQWLTINEFNTRYRKYIGQCWIVFCGVIESAYINSEGDFRFSRRDGAGFSTYYITHVMLVDKPEAPPKPKRIEKKKLLNVLRNPVLWDKKTLSEARLQAADMIEELSDD